MTATEDADSLRRARTTGAACSAGTGAVTTWRLRDMTVAASLRTDCKDEGVAVPILRGCHQGPGVIGETAVNLATGPESIGPRIPWRAREGHPRCAGVVA